jgi:two-component system sensor histidine kinase KdpD
MLRWSDRLSLLVAGAAIVLVTVVFRSWLHLTSPTIAALSYLLIVLLTATVSRLRVALATCIVADLFLNYFFMPPFGTLIIADPQNWAALFVFAAVSVVAGSLSAALRRRAIEVAARRDELARLFELSRDVLLTTDSAEAIPQLARFVSRRFDLGFAAICLPRGADWEIWSAGAIEVPLGTSQLSLAFAGPERVVEFDAQARAYSGHQTIAIDGRSVHLVPLRLGTRPVGLLAAAGRPIEPGTLDALAGVVAIAIERAQFLEERKTAELARQSEALKSALLASISHDLRTPLTTIRVAASNLQASWLADADRRDQSDLILAEVERLHRLFQNILEMARIDAGALSPQLRWVHPSEIVEAARDQADGALRRRRVDLQIDSDGLRITVRDHGPGIAPGDLPHLFERFYRGAESKRRVAGTGMGLSIARGMLAAERGRIWAEPIADGGAQFTIVVTADQKAPIPVEQTS